jgi:predicted GNAT family acetyltransferase
MNTSDTAGAVRHNSAESRFEIAVDGRLAVADYELGQGTMVMTHTFVPPELRGKGLAEKVVRAALEYARRENLKVVPACSYVQVFIERNVDFKSLLV